MTSHSECLGGSQIGDYLSLGPAKATDILENWRAHAGQAGRAGKFDVDFCFAGTVDATAVSAPPCQLHDRDDTNGVARS